MEEWKEGNNAMRSRKFCLTNHIYLAVVFFACLFAPYANGNSSEKASAAVSTSGLAAWREVIRKKFDDQIVHTWCDSKSLLVWVGKAGEGGETTPNRILHINVITGKKTTIVDAPNTTSDMYCGNDGKTVFYQVLTPPIGRQTWTYEMATGKHRHIGGQLNDYFRAPASPKENIFVVNAGKKSWLNSWKKEEAQSGKKIIDLADWKILWFPQHSIVTKQQSMESVESSGVWARDGSYFIIGRFAASRGTNSWGYVYNPEGKLIKDLSGLPSSAIFRIQMIAPMPDGYYYLDDHYRLRRLDVRRGKINTLPVRLFDKVNDGAANYRNYFMDLSPQGELVYYLSPTLSPRLKLGDTRFEVRDTKLYLIPVSGGTPVVLQEQGGKPAFSRDGNYLAVSRDRRFDDKKVYYPAKDKDPGYELLILQRIASDH